MAKLYFRYGAMGSSKTANALMVAYNYKERGKKVLLAKPKLDTREVGVMHSRIGLEQPCIYVEDLVEKSLDELNKYDCIKIDRDYDMLRDRNSEIFVFKKYINNILVYIKLTINERGVICISFHKSL